MTDWKFPQVGHHRARKQYVCCMCSSLILPEDAYCRVVDIDRGKYAVDRYCAPCDLALENYILDNQITEDDFLPDASELHSYLSENLAGKDKIYQDLLSKCLARLNRKLGWDK